MSRQTLLPRSVRRALVAHARETYPEECCGLLVGRGRTVLFAVRMQNVAASAVRFQLDDRAHIDLRKILRTFAPPLAIVGVYHSHPDGTATPSTADAAEAHYPEWVYIIVGVSGRRTRFGAFRIRRGRAHPIRLR